MGDSMTLKETAEEDEMDVRADDLFSAYHYLRISTDLQWLRFMAPIARTLNPVVGLNG